MRLIQSLYIVSAAFMFSGSANADCAPEQLVGTWICRGAVCTPGHLESTLTLDSACARINWDPRGEHADYKI